MLKAVISPLLAFFRLLSLALPSRRALVLENLALRRQIAVYQRTTKRPRLRDADRLFWVWLSRCWSGWRDALIFVQPRTVVGWHRRGFRLYWRWKSRQSGRKTGRPRITAELRALIREMKRANPLWGALRIHGELLKLGIEVSERTVSRWLPRLRKPLSQIWRTFLANHAGDLVSLDFFTVPTLGFRILFVFIVVAHERRRVVHFNVTSNPTAVWTAQQMREAFPDDSAPRYLLRDHDGIYGEDLREQVAVLIS